MNKKGFTLVELLAVIAILALIIIIVATNGFGVFNKTKDGINQAEKDNIKESAKVFLVDIENCDNEVISLMSTDIDIDSFSIDGVSIDSNNNGSITCEEVQTYASTEKSEGKCINIPYIFLKNKNYFSKGTLENEDYYNSDEFKINGCVNLRTKEKNIVFDEIQNSPNTIYVDYYRGNDSNDGSFSNPVKTLNKAFNLSNNDHAVTAISLKSNYIFEEVENIENTNDIVLKGNNKTIEFRNVADNYYIKNNNNLIIENLNFENGGKIIDNLGNQRLVLKNIKVSKLRHTFINNSYTGIVDIDNSKFTDNSFLVEKSDDIIVGGDQVLLTGGTINIKNSSFTNNEYKANIIENDTITSTNENSTIRGYYNAFCIYANNGNISNTTFQNNNVEYINRPIIRGNNIKMEDCNFIDNKITTHKSYIVESGINITRIEYILIDAVKEIEFNNVNFQNNQHIVMENSGPYGYAIWNESVLLKFWNKTLINNSKIQNNKIDMIFLRYNGSYDSSSDYSKIINTEILHNEVGQALVQLYNGPIEIKDSVIENNTYGHDFFCFNTVPYENKIINTQIKNNIGGVNYPYNPSMFFSLNEETILTIDSNSLLCGNKSDTDSYMNDSYSAYDNFGNYSNNATKRDEC